MAQMPLSGVISIADANTVLGRSAGTQTSLNDSAVRTLFGVASGTISLSDGYGKPAGRVTISVPVSAHTLNMSVVGTSLTNYSAGKSDVTITINSGVYVYGDQNGSAALTISGFSSGDTVTLVNNGYILGAGGTGGGYNSTGTIYNYGISAGKPAILTYYPLTITNNAYIAGGGGGGGAASTTCGGGGAGGGAGGTYYSTSIYYGGAGGGIGGSGSNGNTYGGGGGGRICPGTSTTVTYYSSTSTGGGAGDPGSAYWSGTGATGNAGGLGGQAGGSGAIYEFVYSGITSYVAAGGGGWGASGGTSYVNGAVSAAGSVGGASVASNGNTISWVSVGTRYGAIT